MTNRINSQEALILSNIVWATKYQNLSFWPRKKERKAHWFKLKDDCDVYERCVHVGWKSEASLYLHQVSKYIHIWFIKSQE